MTRAKLKACRGCGLSADRIRTGPGKDLCAPCGQAWTAFAAGALAAYVGQIRPAVIPGKQLLAYMAGDMADVMLAERRKRLQ